MVADAFKRIVRFVDAASGAVPTPADELFVLLHALHGGVGKPCPSLLESDAPLRSPAEEQVLKLEYVLLAIEVREKNNTRLPFLVRREGQVIEAELALLAIKERRVACCAARSLCALLLASFERRPRRSIVARARIARTVSARTVAMYSLSPPPPPLHSLTRTALPPAKFRHAGDVHARRARHSAQPPRIRPPPPLRRRSSCARSCSPWRQACRRNLS